MNSRNPASRSSSRHSKPVILRAARVELPEESPDPVLLPSITLLERAASRGSDPAGLPLPPPHMLAGQYRMIRPLGYGGMGEVYLALDTKVDNREVAIKVLRGEQAAAAAEALAQERRALVDLSHDDIIRVFNYGHHPEIGDFLVLQYVDGLTLEEVRARAQVNPGEFGGGRFHEFVLAYGIRLVGRARVSARRLARQGLRRPQTGQRHARRHHHEDHRRGKRPHGRSARPHHGGVPRPDRRPQR
ncbi:protein kinase domain-containing protein [Streptomyces sp. GLT-R25]